VQGSPFARRRLESCLEVNDRFLRRCHDLIEAGELGEIFSQLQRQLGDNGQDSQSLVETCFGIVVGVTGIGVRLSL